MICLSILVAVVLVVRHQSLPDIDLPSLKRGLPLFILSYLVIVYEIVGIIFGQRRSRRLEALLPELLGEHYRNPPITRDQLCLPTCRTMLPWEQRLHRVWRCGSILAVGAAGCAIGLVVGYTFFSTATDNYWVATALAVWLGFGGFWATPALYHLSAISWFIHRLSSQADKTVFVAPADSGMNWVARLAFQYLLLYSGAAFLWALVIFIAIGWNFATVLCAGVMSLFGFIGFALPQLSIRAELLRRKREMLNGILAQIQSNDSISATAPEASRLMILYNFVSAVPPSGLIGTAARSVAASLLPLSLALIHKATEVFPDSTVLQVVASYLP
jgi:hypothetical protein